MSRSTERNPDHRANVCLVCEGSSERSLDNLFDTRFGIASNYAIFRCTDCGLEQLSPLPDADFLKRLYQKYYNFGGERGRSYEIWRRLFLSSFLYRIWLFIDGDISFHAFRGGGRLLDVGCNEGRGLVLYRKNGFSVEGLEVNEEAARIASNKGFIVHTTEIDDFVPQHDYDVVVLSNVLEHALDPKKMLLHVHRLLDQRGRLLISCPNNRSFFRRIFGRYWINWHVPFHVTHFSEETLTKILADTDFELISIKSKSPALWIASSLLTRIAAKPGEANHTLRSKSLICLALTIRLLFSPLLWIVNRLGRGDCLLAVAGKS